MDDETKQLIYRLSDEIAEFSGRGGRRASPVSRANELLESAGRDPGPTPALLAELSVIINRPVRELLKLDPRTVEIHRGSDQWRLRSNDLNVVHLFAADASKTVNRALVPFIRRIRHHDLLQDSVVLESVAHELREHLGFGSSKLSSWSSPLRLGGVQRLRLTETLRLLHLSDPNTADPSDKLAAAEVLATALLAQPTPVRVIAEEQSQLTTFARNANIATATPWDLMTEGFQAGIFTKRNDQTKLRDLRARHDLRFQPDLDNWPSIQPRHRN